jgi:hypothetical protein
MQGPMKMMALLRPWHLLCSFLLCHIVDGLAAVLRVDVAAALHEAVRLLGRGAGDVLGEALGRRRSGREGGEDGVQVGMERAATRVICATIACSLEVDNFFRIARCGVERHRAEEQEQKKPAHG